MREEKKDRKSKSWSNGSVIATAESHNIIIYIYVFCTLSDF